ncbi:hypothetical protein Clacol_002820 [Clathrus columnatus]|uniref:Clathrin light chain n=1 Tax=Clathrus columnatus TaxID=1419009 RepID=A0AAV5A7Q7_9AGAM|nr:hypothetical protein Clacol_002820 [Clathrus columnatus]
MSDDLLARERELLGDTFGAPTDVAPGNVEDIDFDRAVFAFPDIGLDGNASVPPGLPSTSSSNFEFNSFASPPPPIVKVTTNNEEIDKFESAFPDIGSTVSPPPARAAFTSTTAFAPRPQVISTPILQAPIDDEEEPEVIKIWRDKQADAIRLRDEESDRKKRDTVVNAQRSIDQFYEEYNTKKERQIKENKEAEAAYLATLADSLSTGTTWSRICELVSLENSQSKTILAQTGSGLTDLTRYREILLRLKREGITAPGAAGK